MLNLLGISQYCMLYFILFSFILFSLELNLGELKLILCLKFAGPRYLCPVNNMFFSDFSILVIATRLLPYKSVGTEVQTLKLSPFD